MKQELLIDNALKVSKELLDKVPQGCLIGRIEAVKENVYQENEAKVVFAEILKERKLHGRKYFLCEGKVFSSVEGEIKVKMSLLSGARESESGEKIGDKKDIEAIENEDYQFVFSEKEIKSFCDLTGDDNYIHKGKKAIVPGMLVLHRIESYLVEVYKNSLNKISADFYFPVYADEKIHIKKGMNILSGYSKKRKCFQVKYQGEK